MSRPTVQQMQTQLLEHQLFSTLKCQIISLATALYGTRSTSPSSFFDVLSFTTPTNDSDSHSETSTSTYNANGILFEEPTLTIALTTYTGPASSPFTAWEMLSYVDDQTSIIGGAEKLLEDLEKGIGGLVGTLIKKGDWTVKHPRIPDLKAAREEEDEDEEVGEEEEAHDDEDTDGGGVEEKGTGRGWWSPSLDPIPEEI